MEHGIDIIGTGLKGRQGQSPFFKSFQQGADDGRLAAAAFRGRHENPGNIRHTGQPPLQVRSSRLVLTDNGNDINRILGHHEMTGANFLTAGRADLGDVQLVSVTGRRNKR